MSYTADSFLDIVKKGGVLTPKEKLIAGAFNKGVLDEVFHARLLDNLDNYVKQSGIQVKYVTTGLSKYCSKEEIDWVVKLQGEMDSGLVYSGELKNPIEDKMMAIAGTCLRNYTSARVAPLQSVLAMLKDNDLPKEKVLLIPNFCLGKNEGGSIPHWEVSALLGMLYSRLTENKKTVMYISSTEALTVTYGDVFLQHFKAHYTFI